jgi:hypothetical protein
MSACPHPVLETYPSNGPLPGRARCGKCGAWLTAPDDPVRAAAPDLLAALRECAAYEGMKLPLTVSENARAAIRKAAS